MTDTLVQILTSYQSPQGLLNPGDITALDPALATAMIAAGSAALSNGGTIEAQSYTRGIGEAETPAQYAAAGFTLGSQQISAAIEGFLGGDNVTIVDGHAGANSEPWA